MIKDNMNNIIALKENTLEHCKRVSYLAGEIAKAIAPEKVRQAYIAGFWHDLGKLIDSDILYLTGKDRPLTTSERKIIEPHALFSAWLFASNYGWNSSKEIKEIINAIANHHKPACKLSNIVHLADFYDALTTRPDYKNGKGPLTKKNAAEVIYDKQEDLKVYFNPRILHL